MPKILPIGWFHTFMGITALVSGAIALYRYKEISLQQLSGRIYLAATLVTAATALVIFQHGVFGPGHALAILTLGALAAGFAAEKLRLFGRFSRYMQAVSYSATLLFHSIPAITDGLLRLPVGDPVLTSIDDPVLKVGYLVLLTLYIVGISFQLRWIKKHST